MVAYPPGSRWLIRLPGRMADIHDPESERTGTMASGWRARAVAWAFVKVERQVPGDVHEGP